MSVVAWIFPCGSEVGHFQADLVVENYVLLELKAAKALEAAQPSAVIKLFKSD